MDLFEVNTILKLSKKYDVHRGLSGSILHFSGSQNIVLTKKINDYFIDNLKHQNWRDPSK